MISLLSLSPAGYLDKRLLSHVCRSRLSTRGAQRLGRRLTRPVGKSRGHACTIPRRCRTEGGYSGGPFEQLAPAVSMSLLAGSDTPAQAPTIALRGRRPSQPSLAGARAKLWRLGLTLEYRIRHETTVSQPAALETSIRHDSVEAPSVGNAPQLVLAGVLECDPRTGREVTHGL
jgi:hypothetical protein